MGIDTLALIFVTVLGACVGSFLNVVIYRMPAGLSIVKPPSHCPKCGYVLQWFDNVPILGWLWLRGKCRKCGVGISWQYPLIEATTAVVFGGWYGLCYFTNLQPMLSVPGIEQSWPIFAVHLFLLGGLLAATMIDARHFIIPIEIPWVITGVALVAMPAGVWAYPELVRLLELPPMTGFAPGRLVELGEPFNQTMAAKLAIAHGEPGPITLAAAPYVTGGWVGAGLGGAIGLAIANILLRWGWIPLSFADESQLPPSDDKATEESPEAFLAYAHPRREMLKECVFLLGPVVGVVVGYYATACCMDIVLSWGNVLSGVLIGYLVGGGVVWATRILGTLGFGKEAMGLGDVHLMAAVGAVAGWQVAVAAFFIAPFFGLAWAVASAGAAKLLKREVRIIPYGPHLAAASVIVLAAREPILHQLAVIMGL